jgi:hypothetical protein
MTDLPATVYIGIGAVIAAVITALISFINLITSKDQSISENRQQWIDAIRGDISKFIGLSAHYSSRLKRIELTKEQDKKDELQIKLFDTGYELVELYNRILLRLNAKENSDIQDALKSIEKFLAGEAAKPRYDTDHMATLTSTLRDLSNDMLKKEWKRVKRGELSYFITKWLFIFGIVFSLLFGAHKINNIYSAFFIKSNLNLGESTPNKPLQLTPKSGAAE